MIFLLILDLSFLSASLVLGQEQNDIDDICKKEWWIDTTIDKIAQINPEHVCKEDENSYSILHLAAGFSNPQVIQSLIDKGANPNAENPYYGITPLFFAVNNAQLENTWILIKNGANINIRENIYQTSPLHFSSNNGNVDIMELLLQEGAEINVMSDYDREGRRVSYLLPKIYLADVTFHIPIIGTPLHIAAKKENFAIVKLLVDNQAKTDLENQNGHTPLDVALKANNRKIIEFLLENGADPKKGGAIHIAVNINRDLEIVKKLVKYGADILIEDRYNNTLLHYVANNGDLDILIYLINKGLDINAQNNYSEGIPVTLKIHEGTPLHGAAGHGHIRVARFLLENGADIDSLNGDERTPLSLAVSKNDRDMFDMLIKNNARADIGIPLVSAAQGCCNETIITLLIENGANMEDRDNDLNQMTPLNYLLHLREWSPWSPNTELFEELLEIMENPRRIWKYRKEKRAWIKRQEASVIILINAGADVNTQDRYGATPLHKAIENKSSSKVILKLLMAGADINATDRHGKKPDIGLVMILRRFFGTL